MAGPTTLSASRWQHWRARQLVGITVMTGAMLLTAHAAAQGARETDAPRPPAELEASLVSHSPAAPAATSARVTKLLVFVVENHSLEQMRRSMPVTWRLATRYGYASHYTAIRHPSLPNYLAMTGGSTYGVTDDRPPAVNSTWRPSVFGRAIEAGATAKLYAEGMPRRCALRDGGNGYVVRHNPWAYHRGERAQCRRHDVRLRRLAPDVEVGRLPGAGMVIPNVCNDAHDCSLRRADRWLARRLHLVLSGSDWSSGRLAVVITADEDDRHHGNRVLTVVAHPSLNGVVVETPLNHYALARSYAEVVDAAPLGEARTAPSLLAAFGLQEGAAG